MKSIIRILFLMIAALLSAPQSLARSDAQVGFSVQFGHRPHYQRPHYHPARPPIYRPWPRPPVIINQPPVIIHRPPPVYIEEPTYIEAPPPPAYSTGVQPENAYWYYCEESEAYYPYEKECPSGWTKVPAAPPQ